jgi:asparagine synthase (glutamine-hydrolysing)
LPESEPGAGEDQILHAISVLESRYYMGNMLLRDTDVCGMSQGLEIRVPFLDRRLIDYVYSLPDRAKEGPHDKSLLRRSLKGAIPDRVLHLPKRGFTLPQASWMQGSLRDFFEDSLKLLRSSGTLDPGCVGRVWEAFLHNPGGPDWARAWMLGVLGGWVALKKKIAIPRREPV